MFLYLTHLVLLVFFILMPLLVSNIVRKNTSILVQALMLGLIEWFLLIFSFQLYLESNFDEVRSSSIVVIYNFCKSIPFYTLLTEGYFIYFIGFFFSYLYTLIVLWILKFFRK
jgi:hypothetical protein